MVDDPEPPTLRSVARSFNCTDADAWRARDHEVKVTRSRKGATSFERVKVNMAPVIGGTHAVAPTDPDAASTHEACTARDRAVLSLMGARRLRLGTNALDVQRATDQHYRSLGLPALVGSDSTSWQGTTNGDRTSRTSVASHRAGIDGTVSASTVNDLAAPSAEYVSNTSDRKAWPIRGEQSTGTGSTEYDKRNGKLIQNFPLPMSHTRQNDPTDRRVFVCHPARTRVTQRGSRIIARTTSASEITSVWSLVAPSVDLDTRWQGHSLVKRASVKRNARKTTSQRVKSVDIGTVSAPTTVNAWRELLANLNRGEKVTAKSHDGRVVISRNAQRYLATDTRGEANVKWSFRSLDAMATHLASA
jgi:hypothetical protein